MFTLTEILKEYLKEEWNIPYLNPSLDFIEVEAAFEKDAIEKAKRIAGNKKNVYYDCAFSLHDLYGTYRYFCKRKKVSENERMNREDFSRKANEILPKIYDDVAKRISETNFKQILKERYDSSHLAKEIIQIVHNC